MLNKSFVFLQVKTNSRNNIFRFYINTLLLFCTFSVFFSCKSKEIVIPPLHKEIYDVETYVVNDNIDGLIQLYPKLLVHKDYAYQSIFCEFDFNKYSYEKLQRLYNLAKCDSALQEGFEAILTQRENIIINDLINKPIDEIAQYYFSHKSQHCFLNTFIDESIMSNIDNMNYFEVKYIAYIFEGSIFYNKLQDRRLKLKKELNKKIRKDVKDYVKTETESLNYLELSIKTYILTYLYEQFPLVINAIIDEDLPQYNSEIIALTEAYINKYISSNHINNYIENEINRYVKEINKAREQVISSLALGGNVRKEYLLQNKQDKRYIKIKYNPQPLFEISKIQHEKDGLGIALGIASFLGSFVPGGILLDALDLGYGIHSEKKRSNKQVPYIKSFTENFRIEMEKTYTNYLNNILRKLKTNFNNSQKKFSNIYYEIY